MGNEMIKRINELCDPNKGKDTIQRLIDGTYEDERPRKTDFANYYLVRKRIRKVWSRKKWRKEALFMYVGKFKDNEHAIDNLGREYWPAAAYAEVKI